MVEINGQFMACSFTESEDILYVFKQPIIAVFTFGVEFSKKLCSFLLDNEWIQHTSTLTTVSRKGILIHDYSH